MLAAGTGNGPPKDSSSRSDLDAIDENERRPAVRALRGWAISVLQDAGAIREREEHGWMKDRADLYSREMALMVACQDPPFGFSPDEALAAVEDVLGAIGDICPECPIAARLLLDSHRLPGLVGLALQ